MSQNTKNPIAAEWLTHAEKTDYRETARYAETIEYAKRLDDASNSVRYESFGKSGEGRELPLLIVSEDGIFDPDEAAKRNIPIVLVQACIHAGESDGKDAGLALIRDIAITQTRKGLTKNLILLFIPIYNVDGHERFGPYNRINQNGPAEMGWRTNTANLNLNRDYMKADAPETRAWLKLWNRWKPDLFVDCHVTDGADYQYNITYQYEHFANIPSSIVNWEKKVFDGVVAQATEAAGNSVSSYLEFRDNRDLTKGINSFIGPPRFSTGYTPMRNRPGLLIETHMLKPYKPRVTGTYDMLRCLIEAVGQDPRSLKSAIETAESQVINEGRSYDAGRQFPLQFELTEKSVPHRLRAVEYKTELSAISGAQRVIFGTKPIELTVPLYDDARPTVKVAPPLYYIIPPQFSSVIEVLSSHGLELRRLKSARQLEVESYRFNDVKFAPSSFEGRVGVSFKANVVTEKRTFPAGSVVVPMEQEAARVALYLLEPESPDSFVSWGFFNAIFEQKEYGEAYVVETLAREMLAKDEKLRREFEDKVAHDPKFASDSRQRLRFFFERSPYWDPQLNLYPVGRVLRPMSENDLE